MWRVVYMAQTKPIADHIVDLLAKEGFLVKLKPIYKNISEDDNYYEVLVPQSEAQEVHDILMDNGF
jgi:flavodoxin